MSSFLYRLGQRCARHPLRVIGVWLLIAARRARSQPAARREHQRQLHRPRGRSPESQRPPQRPFPRVLRSIRDRSCSTSTTGSVTDPQNAEAIGLALDQLRDGHDVTAVSDPFDARGPTVSADGRTAFATVNYSHRPARERARRGGRGGRRDRPRCRRRRPSSPARWSHAEIHGSEHIGLAVAVIVLLVAFGSMIAMAIPIVTALIGLMIGLGGVGIMAYFVDTPVTSTMIASMIGLGVGIDYALFVVTRHRQHLARGDVRRGRRRYRQRHRGSVGVVRRHDRGDRHHRPGDGRPAGDHGDGLRGGDRRAVLDAHRRHAAAGVPRARRSPHRPLGDPAPQGSRRRERTRRFAGRWAHHVGKRPWRYALLSLIALLAIGRPGASSSTMGFADDSNTGDETTQHKAYDLLSRRLRSGLQRSVDGRRRPLGQHRSGGSGRDQRPPSRPTPASPPSSRRWSTSPATPRSSSRSRRRRRRTVRPTTTVKRLRADVLPGDRRGHRNRRDGRWPHGDAVRPVGAHHRAAARRSSWPWWRCRSSC